MKETENVKRSRAKSESVRAELEEGKNNHRMCPDGLFHVRNA
jgi:hypothetical protein